MGKPKKIKKTVMEEPKITKTQEDQAIEDTKSQVDDSPVEKTLFYIDEAADYFGVTSDCIKLWIDHGHLQKADMLGPVRIPITSMLGCRFKRYFSEPIL